MVSGHLCSLLHGDLMFSLFNRLGLGLASDLNASVSPRSRNLRPRSRLDRSRAIPVSKQDKYSDVKEFLHN